MSERIKSSPAFTDSERLRASLRCLLHDANGWTRQYHGSIIAEVLEALLIRIDRLEPHAAPAPGSGDLVAEMRTMVPGSGEIVWQLREIGGNCEASDPHTIETTCRAAAARIEELERLLAERKM